ncbi:MAG: hypothetical protein Q9157_000678 [Trypethelium eluteriae]
MEFTPLRKPGPNEKRCATRHDLGFYSNLVVGGIYSFEPRYAKESELQHLDLYSSALIDCIRQHPYLSVAIQGIDSTDPVLVRSTRIDLRNHFRALRTEELKTNITSQGDEAALLQRAIEQLHNDERFMFTDVESKPAWSVDVLVLPRDERSAKYRVFISFTYSHSLGDGLSGIAFHRTFYEALQRNLQSNESAGEAIIETLPSDLPDPGDAASKLPISWTYLLSPVLGSYLPSLLSRLLGVTAKLSGADDRTWTGSKTFSDTRTLGMRVTTSVEIVTITAQTLQQVLAVCKRHGTTLTPLLSYLIAQVMSSALGISDKWSEGNVNFVTTVPVNLRKALKVSEDVIGNYPSAAFMRHDLHAEDAHPLERIGCLDEQSWQYLRSESQKLADVASRARDQPIGLLRYVSDFRTWMQDQVGGSRDSSWELSNLGSFNPTRNTPKNPESLAVDIEKMMFSQPASPIGPPLNFNVIGIRDGELNVCITWQVGSLGITRNDENESEERNERRLVGQVITSLITGLQEVGRTS